MNKKAIIAISISTIIMVAGYNVYSTKKGRPLSSGAIANDTLLVSIKYHVPEGANCDTSNTRFVILQEDDNTMFAEMNKVVDAFGKYFIVDTYESRKVVSFTHDGKPFASYGRKGNGPGEYVFPWDIDVSTEHVYVLDISQRKILKYNHHGNFIDSKNIPFESKGFTLLKNGNMLFKLEPSKDSDYQLCITDSMLNPQKYMLHYPDGYVGGWVTDNVFQKNSNGISYYCSPSDTIYRLDHDGNLTGKRLIKFENGPIHESAKINFIEAEEKGKITYGMHLLNNPVELPNGICFMEVTDYTNEGTYTITSNPENVMNKAKKFAENMSVYDVIIPCTSNNDNRVISYLDKMIADKCYDLKAMPDGLAKALDEGYRLLVIHNFD